jgi:hypothetical protein
MTSHSEVGRRRSGGREPADWCLSINLTLCDPAPVAFLTAPHTQGERTALCGERPDSIGIGSALRCLLAHETCARSATGNRLEFAHVNRHFSCRFLRIAVVEHARLAGWCIYNVVGFAKYPFLDTPASACWGRGEGRAQRVYRGRLTPPQHARHPCCLLAEFMPSLLLFRLRPSNAPSEAWRIRRC